MTVQRWMAAAGAVLGIMAAAVILTISGWSQGVKAAAPAYEKQILPANGAVIAERRPLIRWRVFPNGNSISSARLLVDGQSVPLRQENQGNAVALSWQPTADLSLGRHTVEYQLGVQHYNAMSISSFFEITGNVPDIYAGADRWQLQVQEQEALRRLNDYRQQLGLTALVKNSRLTQSAQAHATYMDTNGVQGHYEKPGTLGFTGITVQNRSEFFGYYSSTGECISYGRGGASQAVDRLMAAPYHRLAIINPNYREAGAGTGAGSQQGSTVINFGDAGSADDERVMLYPYDGQSDVPLAWLDNEQPNPLAHYGKNHITVGYPISLSIYGSQIKELKTLRATLKDETGSNVPCYINDSTVDSDHKKHVFLIPMEPLKPGKRYVAAVDTQQVGQADTPVYFSRTWSFATLPQLEINQIQVLKSKQIDILDVQLKNGDIPDLKYVLRYQGREVFSYDQQTRGFTYVSPNLPNGDYFLEISSALFSRKLQCRLIISGSGMNRQVTLVREAGQ